MQRRVFCTQTCQIASLAALASLVEGCGGSPTSPSGSGSPLPVVSGTSVAGGVAIGVDPGSPLASVGGAVLAQTPAGSFLVVRSSQDAFTAMTAVCTHEGCMITDFSASTFVCNCHGSQFSLTGSVVKGPAVQSLRRFSAALIGNVLTITL